MPISPIITSSFSSNIPCSGPATLTSRDNQQEVTFASTHRGPTTVPSLFEDLHFTVSLSENPVRGLPQQPLTHKPFIPDVRYLFSRPNHFTSRATVDNLFLDRQHCREFYISRADVVTRP